MSSSVPEDHDDLRRLIRGFLQQKSSSRDVRTLMDADDACDEAVWAQMAGQLGLQGLTVPEEYGGAGFGPAELGIVLEEMGRVLLVAPYFATVVLAGQTLTASGDDEAKRRWLPGIANGSLTATVALAEESGTWDLTDVAATAEPEGADWVVNGAKLFVVDGHTADLLLVVARVANDIGVFAVEGNAPGVTRAKLESLDRTRDLASVVLAEAPAIRVGPARDATAWLSAVNDAALAALAAETIGGAARCLELAVEYAKLREQFDRPIGSFQAIKHKCANLLVEIESGRSAAYHASAAVADPGPDASIAAALAKTYCSRAFTRAAKECIQIHGGIGYTWEHDAHLYLRRAKSSELLFGTPSRLRSHLASLAGI